MIEIFTGIEAASIARMRAKMAKSPKKMAFMVWAKIQYELAGKKFEVRRNRR